MAVKHSTASDATFSAGGATAWDANHTVDDNTLVAAKLSATATDKVFGRSTSGAGAGEEIACTAAGRALIDDASAADQRTTLGLGTIATAAEGGRVLATTLLTSASANHTTNALTTKAHIHMVGPGGGGGGAASAAVNAAAAAGGSAGSYLFVVATLSGNTAYAYTNSTGGTGGANTGGTGNPGSGTATFVNGATTYTVNPGNGGAGMTAGTGVTFSTGGAQAAVSTNGTINSGGEPGDFGVRTSGTVGQSGAGGSSQFGSGGSALGAGGAGVNALGYGAGGGGALVLNGSAAAAGGAGGNSCILIIEYS